ncbi:MgtC/SapB family protein [Kaistia dalseonensis]|uniref:Protein MgtC n=1 Tax=Kaistia dalseonensis TaxID=410840 RepID=A0ABU0HAF2_9HYPH|nr:MgtC/SapB family protein [Kaistia dalseonensis]MCX5496669.1 MgtC/SapB family protein [Kaistia dalseonensis]MDQ0439293.1 putative Mg2+ transporter-C (MgtC) family protein [Kaistia dalseonensis]
MKFVQAFDLMQFVDTIISFTAAFIFGAMIGAERQYRQRTAGLRTNVLVALGAAAFVDLAQRIAGTTEAVRVISYVVSGIGFLGAGVIMKEGMNVRGLNTAATLWCSAAVGACTGTDMLAEGALLTVFVLVGNTLLHPLAHWIDRAPLDDKSAEAIFEVKLLTTADALPSVRDMLVERLEAAKYPVGDVETVDRAGHTVEITATLVSSSVEAKEIDAVAADLEKIDDVLYVTWDSSTKD